MRKLSAKLPLRRAAGGGPSFGRRLGRKITPLFANVPTSQVPTPFSLISFLPAPTMLRTSALRTTRSFRVTPTLTRFYHEKVIDHYERPRNVGSLPKTDVDVGTGLYSPPKSLKRLSFRLDLGLATGD
jgi:NifU-like N terminal domain